MTIRLLLNGLKLCKGEDMWHIRGIGGTLYRFVDRWWYIPDGIRTGYTIKWYEISFVLLFGNSCIFKK